MLKGEGGTFFNGSHKGDFTFEDFFAKQLHGVSAKTAACFSLGAEMSLEDSFLHRRINAGTIGYIQLDISSLF